MSTHLPASERLRLWLSYQRYALLLLLLPPLVLALVAWRWPEGWWLWAPLGLIALRLIRFGHEIWGRWPRKMRATLLADRRIAAGRFRPATVKGYCGDPCFRVVARELLRRAGIPPRERRALIQRFHEAVRAADRQVVVFDRRRGAVIEFDGTHDEGVVRWQS